MKTLFSEKSRVIQRMIFAAMCMVPSLLLAHPGHYHPEETDEFDFLRATFFHSHGAMDYVLAGVALTSIAIAIMASRPAAKIGAIAVALSSLSLLPVI
jgi:hypothetical protein